MIENIERIGSFTSSKAYLLCAKGESKNGFSAGALTYIKSRQQERKLMRSIDVEVKTRDMLWGLCLEGFVEKQLDEFGYELISNKSKMHPLYHFWAGSTDLLKLKQKVGDIKCYKPMHFSELSDSILANDTGHFKETSPKEYWQLVSNAIINEVTHAESIAFMPSIDQLPAIAEYISQLDEMEQLKYEFIYNDIVNERLERLPYLPANSDYKPLNRFEFEVPKEDIEFLTKRVLLAESMITKSQPSVLLAHRDTDMNATIIEPEFNLSKLKKITPQ